MGAGYAVSAGFAQGRAVRAPVCCRSVIFRMDGSPPMELWLRRGRNMGVSGRLIRIAAAIVGACVVLAGLAEVVARYALDFPLYGADAEVGYYMKPNQSGTFLFRNDWVFNELSMGVAEEYKASDKQDILLIGDSIVSGGIRVAQRERIGPMLEEQTGWQVWPVSAASWALQNEVTFLGRMPDAVRDADTIVFVVNSADFGEPSSWASNITHPRTRPTLYLSYLAAKLLGAPSAKTPPDLKVRAVPDLAAMWQRFRGRVDAPVIVVGYPKKDEIHQGCAWVPKWLATSAHFVCYGQEGGLSEEDYHDDIHPTIGNARKLVSTIERAIDEAKLEEAHHSQQAGADAGSS